MDQHTGRREDEGQPDHAQRDPQVGPLLKLGIDRIRKGGCGDAHQFRNEIDEGRDDHQDVGAQGDQDVLPAARAPIQRQGGKQENERQRMNGPPE